jgi:hypothetical protein
MRVALKRKVARVVSVDQDIRVVLGLGSIHLIRSVLSIRIGHVVRVMPPILLERAVIQLPN